MKFTTEITAEKDGVVSVTTTEAKRFFHACRDLAERLGAEARGFSVQSGITNTKTDVYYLSEAMHEAILGLRSMSAARSAETEQRILDFLSLRGTVYRIPGEPKVTFLPANAIGTKIDFVFPHSTHLTLEMVPFVTEAMISFVNAENKPFEGHFGFKSAGQENGSQGDIGQK